MANQKKWIVTTSGDRSIKEVQKELLEKGFKVDQVFDEIGSIIGEAEDEVVKKARGISGVADVSPEAPINIGPPGSDDTW
jgi:hypothetical protein